MNIDWAIPESWLAENANAAHVAADLRYEAAMFAGRARELRDTGGDPADIDGLELSRMHCIQHAARIERHLRGLE